MVSAQDGHSKVSELETSTDEDEELDVFFM